MPSLVPFQKLRLLELKESLFSNAAMSPTPPVELSRLFDFTDLPPTLEELTIPNANTRSILEYLRLNVNKLHSVPNLKKIHNIHKDGDKGSGS
jgi:hypothetical protein